MATQEQIAALVRAHTKRDDKMFRAVTLQIADHMDKGISHQRAADLRRMVEPDQYTPVAVLQPEAQKLLTPVPPRDLADLVLPVHVGVVLRDLKREWAARQALRDRGMDVRRRILMIGPPGTGKTVTAGAIAGELGIPCFTTRLENVVGSHLGETGKSLRTLFDAVRTVPAVFLMDEFDAVAAHRVSQGKQDVEEMRRALNSLLQFLDEPGEGVVVAATNLDGLLDHAVLRRFDVVLQFMLPAEREARVVVQKVLQRCGVDMPGAELGTVEMQYGLSHAEIEGAVMDAVRAVVCGFGPQKVVAADVSSAIQRRAWRHILAKRDEVGDAEY